MKKGMLEYLTLQCRIPFTLILCENSERQYLLLRRFKPPYPQKWNFLGGKIETGESPVESACRELVEEVGIVRRTRSMNFCGIVMWPETSENRLIGMFLFKTSFIRKEHDYSQMSIIDEGLLSWNYGPKNTEKKDYVPNFGILMDVFSAGKNRPYVIVHGVDHDENYWSEQFKLGPSMLNLHKIPFSPEPIKVEELITIPLIHVDDDQDYPNVTQTDQERSQTRY